MQKLLFGLLFLVFLLACENAESEAAYQSQLKKIEQTKLQTDSVAAEMRLVQIELLSCLDSLRNTSFSKENAFERDKRIKAFQSIIVQAGPQLIAQSNFYPTLLEEMEGVKKTSNAKKINDFLAAQWVQIDGIRSSLEHWVRMSKVQLGFARDLLKKTEN